MLNAWIAAPKVKVFRYCLEYQHTGKPSLKLVGVLAGSEPPSQIKASSFCTDLKICEDEKLPGKS